MHVSGIDAHGFQMQVSVVDIRQLTAGSDPDRLLGTKDRFKGADEPPGSKAPAGDLLIGVAVEIHRLHRKSVGDDDQLRHGARRLLVG